MQSCEVASSPLWARAPRTKPFAAKLCAAEGAGGDEEPMNRSARCATPREAAWGQLGSRGAKSAEGPRARGRVRNRRSRGRNKSSASLVEGRRPGPGQIPSRHGGGIEAVSASLVGSEERAPRKAQRRHRSGVCDRGVRGSVTQARGPGAALAEGRTRPHEACAIRRSDRRAVKRAGLQSSWAASQEVHAR